MGSNALEPQNVDEKSHKEAEIVDTGDVKL